MESKRNDYDHDNDSVKEKDTIRTRITKIERKQLTIHLLVRNATKLVH